MVPNCVPVWVSLYRQRTDYYYHLHRPQYRVSWCWMLNARWHFICFRVFRYYFTLFLFIYFLYVSWVCVFVVQMGFKNNLTLKSSILLVIQRNLAQHSAHSVGLSLAQLIAFHLNSHHRFLFSPATTTTTKRKTAGFANEFECDKKAKIMRSLLSHTALQVNYDLLLV